MDQAVWISWYDLPDSEGARADYLAWAHKCYIPELLKRNGWLWAAHYASTERPSRMHSLSHSGDAGVPTGDRYILMFAAEHANVFGDPAIPALHAAFPDRDKAMLAMRIGERSNVFAEASRVDGPEARPAEFGKAFAPCIQLGSFNIEWRDEDELLAWYTQWRMPAMREQPGMVRVRKFASVAGWAKHGILYEWTSLELRNRYFPVHEDAHPEMKAWSGRMVPKLIHAPGSSNVACRIWPPCD
jgi:hypothetical protein